jgi:hypothetical protein
MENILKGNTLLEKPVRRLDNWLKAYTEWVGPRVTVPPQYTAWCGLFALAASLERKIKIPRKYLGGFDCDPFLYVTLIGEPGIGKGTSMGQVERILSKVPTLNKGEQIFTKERLMQQLIEKPRSAIYLILGELADALQKNKATDIFGFLLTLYDGKDELSEGTRLRASEVAVRPSLNKLAGTTSAWIKENVSHGIIGGGYPSRVCWVYADRTEAGPVKVFYHRDINLDTFDQKEEDLVHDLNIIANLTGDMKLTDGDWNDRDDDLRPYGDDNAAYFFEQYEKNLKHDFTDANTENFLARRRTQCHKLAMLHSVSLRSDLVITEADYKFAIKAIETTEKKVHRVLGGIGTNNPYKADINLMVDYVIQEGVVERNTLLIKFEGAAPAQQLINAIEMLKLTERLTEFSKDGKVYYGIGASLAKLIEEDKT